jgi:hypothetical protein
MRDCCLLIVLVVLAFVRVYFLRNQRRGIEGFEGYQRRLWTRSVSIDRRPALFIPMYALINGFSYPSNKRGSEWE